MSSEMRGSANWGMTTGWGTGGKRLFPSVRIFNSNTFHHNGPTVRLQWLARKVHSQSLCPRSGSTRFSFYDRWWTIKKKDDVLIQRRLAEPVVHLLPCFSLVNNHPRYLDWTQVMERVTLVPYPPVLVRKSPCGILSKPLTKDDIFP